MNSGSFALAATGASLADICGRLARRGVKVVRATASNWRAGKTSPSEEAREAISAEFGIAAGSWDVAVSPAGKARAPSPHCVKPRRHERGAARPLRSASTHQRANADPSGRISTVPPEDRAELAQAVAEQVRAAVERIALLRAEADLMGTPSAKAQAMRLELHALEVLARITGETPPATVTEAVLVKSAAWRRLRDRIIAAFMKHPEAAADVMAALDPGGSEP
jgi:hypothetical protein